MTANDDPHLVSRSTTNVSPFQTGSWRQIAPLHRERLSPCTDLCPCFGSIPKWLDLVRKGRFAEAWQTMIIENPFPLTCGRVCYRFCEAKCNRGDLDDKISIGAVERFLGEYAVRNGLRPEIPIGVEGKGRRIAVVGGGPAGLAAAHMLRRSGATVTVYDGHEELGGLLRYGIPEYRLPKALLRKELTMMIESFGIQRVALAPIDASALSMLSLSHDYVVLATGTHKAKAIMSEKGDPISCMNGLKFLEDVAEKRPTGLPELAQRVIVVGGGNTAIDVSRTLVRLGVPEVMIVYRRGEEMMPAHRDEIVAAKNEGVRFRFWSLPLFTKTAVNGLILLACARTELRETDGGRKQPASIPGSDFVLPCDALISAIGEEADLTTLSSVGACPASEEESLGNVFVCGDALNGPHSVSEAIASGKKAAESVMSRIAGRSPKERPHDTVGADEINFSYLRAVRKDPRVLGERKLSATEIRAFAETTSTLTEDMAKREADRCINCGTCIACDRCLSFCPDFCIRRDPEGAYAINYDTCKGCGICAEVCERAVITYGKEGPDVRD